MGLRQRVAGESTVSVLFPANLYGNAALMFDPNGTMGSASATGPNIVRWMLGGRNTLVTVNGSNLGSPSILTYANFASVVRFARPGNTFPVVMTRIGPHQQIVPLSARYPT